MKPFDELSDFEKSQLFPDEIEFYINLECAMQGVELLPSKAPVAPDKGEIEGDITVWRVAGYYFRKREQAAAVQTAILGNCPVDDSYLPGGDYTRKTIGTYTPQVQVTEETWYSPKRWAAVKDRVAKYDAAVNAYKTELATYERIANARQSIEERITGAIDDAVCRIRRQEKMKTIIEQYLELAQDDREIALGYLRKVYPDIEADNPELLAELGFNVTLESTRKAA